MEVRMNTDFLHGVEVVEVNDGIRPIRTLKSSVIGLTGTAGKGQKNEATLVTNLREAVAKFGAWDDTDGFTIPAALKAIYSEFKATVVVVNVVDAATDKASIADEAFTFGKYDRAFSTAKRFVSNVVFGGTYSAPVQFATTALSSVTLPAGVTVTAVKSLDGGTTYVLDTDYSVAANVLSNLGAAIDPGETVTVEFTSTLVENTDYVVDADTGDVTMGSSPVNLLPQTSGTVSYDHVDPSAITETEIIGGVNETTDDYEGAWEMLSAKTKLGLQPRILLAPGFTHQKEDSITRNPVVAQLDILAHRLGAITLADGPNTTDEAAVQYAADWGSARIMVLDPHVRVEAPSGPTIEQPYSPVFAGVMARTDAEFGFWASPSNKLIRGIVGTARPIEFALNDPNSRANYLNEHNVTTIVSEGGFRTWGNRTVSSDPKWSFLNVRRGADIIQESILFAHLWAVDRNITKNFVEELVEGVNRYLRYLQTIGAILGGQAWADPDINTPTVISQGQLFIDFDFTVPYVAERITFRAHLVDDYVTEIFK
jgi:phage tail sheath protein FI